MNDVRWERIKDLLHQAMQLSPDQRARFLDETCPQGDSCRVEVDSLLAADEDARSSFMGNSGPMSGLARALEAGLAPGELFEGRFLLKERLGEGGMGQVWLAEQTAPVRRQVALKLIKAGMYDQSVLQRFRSERQSLALMDHPAIAKVFEAGATAQGQPYFVMEYVPGEPITQYCDRRRMGIGERLELMIQTCEGVQHAHQKAIVHRDLKPANILVVELDGKPVPRIIDFGLAKPITRQPAGEGDCTLLGQFVGTPGYMSPEQVDPDVRDIDTRTDVYSLGVVLYVLLCGRRPFDADAGRKPPLDELLRKLREEDPPPPSASLAGAGDLKAAIAAARGVEPKQLARSLRGDLDSIAAKALERSRTRRYDTALELAADLKRYRADEPVMARPAGPAYRLKKYARRHRVAVGIGAGLMLLLGAFSILEGFELHRTEQERDRANLERDRAGRERDRATRITDFMTNMFRVSDPSEARGSSVTAREILDKASTEMASGLAHDADAQSQMLYVMASTYLNLGLYARAHELAERAWQARKRLYGAGNPSTLESLAQLGWILDREGRLPEAEQLERQALASLREMQGPDSPLALESTDHLAVIEEDQGHYQEAERLAREVMEGAGRTLGPESRLALLSANHFAQALWDQGLYVDAEQQYRRLVDIDARVLGSDHPQTLAARLNLALAIASQQRAVEAEALYRDVLSAQERVLGPEHPYTVLTMESLAIALINAGHLAEGEKLHRRVLAIRMRTLGAEHPDTLNSQLNLADVLLKEDHVAEADKLQRAALAVQQRVLGAQNPETLFSESNLAAILVREHRYAEAETLAAETLAAQRRSLGQAHPETLTTLRILGRALAYAHRYAQASRLLREQIEQLNGGADEPARAAAWYAFACVAVAARRADEAVLYLKEAVRRGYRDVEGLEADEDLRDLRRNPGYLELVHALKGRPVKEATAESRAD